MALLLPVACVGVQYWWSWTELSSSCSTMLLSVYCVLPQGASAPVTPAHAASFQGPQISLEVMQTHLRFPGHGRIKVSIGSNSYVAELRHVIGAKLSQPPAQIRLIYGGTVQYGSRVKVMDGSVIWSFLIRWPIKHRALQQHCYCM